MGERIEFTLGKFFLDRVGVDLTKYVSGSLYPPKEGQEAWFEDLEARPYYGRIDEGIRTTGTYVIKLSPGRKPKMVEIDAPVGFNIDSRKRKR